MATQRKHNRYTDIYGLFLFAKVLKVGNQWPTYPKRSIVSPVIERISLIASMVTSEDVAAVKENCDNGGVFGLLKALYTSSGRISIGTEMSARESYHKCRFHMVDLLDFLL